MNWEDTSPGSVNAPGCSAPEQRSMFPCRSMPIPCAHSSRASGSIGRSGKRPRSINSASAPSAPANGSRKRSVVPLSPQSRRRVPPSVLNSALRHALVARISCELPAFSTRTGCSVSAAQMRYRCACDFDAGARTSPRRAPGSMSLVILFRPLSAIRKARRLRRSLSGSGLSAPELSARRCSRRTSCPTALHRAYRPAQNLTPSAGHSA